MVIPRHSFFGLKFGLFGHVVLVFRAVNAEALAEFFLRVDVKETERFSNPSLLKTVMKSL
jgi:hypothetical protein